MVKIAKLRLKNFKSFKKAEIPFSEGFTSIVGSNASGKSNILDSIMFVFGATSLKMLRAAKLVDLVNHDASEDYAKVEIELKHTDKKYVISRTIDRQGRGVYRLDDKRKPMNEVVALLEEIGVNAKGHNLVAQGDVTRVIEMNPKQRREIIDEIAGLSEFEYKKEEALKKLDKVDQKVKDANIVLKEREAYLEELEMEKTAALKYQELTKELKRSKATLLYKEISRIRSTGELNKKKQETLEKQTEERGNERNTLSENLRAAEKKLEEINDRLLRAKESIYSTIGKSVEEKRSEIKVLRERTTSMEEHNLSKKNRLQTLKQKLKQLQSATNEKEIKSRDYEIEIKTINAELRPLEREERERARSLKERLEKIKAIEEELSETVNNIENLQKQFYGKDSEAAAIQQEVKIINERVGQIGKLREEAKLDERRERLKKITSDFEDVQAKLKELSGNVAVKAHIDKLIEKITEIASEIREMEKLIEFFIKSDDRAQLKDIMMASKKQLAVVAKEKSHIKFEIQSLDKEKQGLQEKIKRIKGIEDAATRFERLQILREKHHAIKEKLVSTATEIDHTKSRAAELESELSLLGKESENLLKRIENGKKSLDALNKELEEKQHELETASRANLLLAEEKQKVQNKIENLGKRKDALENQIEKMRKETNELAIELSKDEVRLEDLSQEYENYRDVEILQDAKIKELEQRIPKIEKEIESLGAINMRALQSFDQYYNEVEDVREKCKKLEEERQSVLEMIDKIELRKMNIFMDCFNAINNNFNKLYYKFFNGEGRLGLTNPENPLGSGLTIEAKYKEDKLKSIDAMSGGEKSLTALAFLFAIQSHEPAPFYIFDEVDAALDKENSLKVAQMIKEISKNLQFVAITHNDAVIKQSDQLIGVALNKQKSSVIGLKLKDRIKEGKKPLEELSVEDIEDANSTKETI